MFLKRIPASTCKRVTFIAAKTRLIASVSTGRAKQGLVLQIAILVLLSLLPIGCGKRGVKVYPVRGEVYFNGQPADGATIHFHPVDKKAGPPAFATVNDDGAYSLTTFKSDDGAAVGEYIVTVIWLEEKEVDGETILGKDRLGGLYAKPDVSKLTATVSPGENEIDRFDLKNK